jgi:hypothetical protein
MIEMFYRYQRNINYFFIYAVTKLFDIDRCYLDQNENIKIFQLFLVKMSIVNLEKLIKELNQSDREMFPPSIWNSFIDSNEYSRILKHFNKDLEKLNFFQ